MLNSAPGRILLMTVLSIAAAFVLEKSPLGDFAGFIAFSMVALGAWHSGPLISLLGPFLLLHVDRLLRLENAAFTTWYAPKELTNLAFYSLVMFTVAWAGNLTRKALKESREREQMLRKQAQNKDEFLATLAHELRNPLAPLQSAVEVIQLASTSSLDPAVLREVHETMRRQIEHLIHLVDDLLDINRISTGKIHLRRELTPLADIVRDAIAAVRPQLESAEHHLVFNPPTEPVLVNGDRTRLLQVILNLLTNASKFTPPGGSLQINMKPASDLVEVTISDTGIGIAPEALPRVFEMFTQIDSGRSQANRGLGIGLSLSKHLISMHDGTIEAHSDGLGKGSQFIVRLPCAAAKQD